MTIEEIKHTYSMRDILVKCGLRQPNKAGFIRCPFHQGDREPSMKIYEHDYNCFACGANGDIFTFIQEFYHFSFKEAFLMLGGTYEKPSFHSKLAIYKVKQERKMKEKKAAELKIKRDTNNMLIDVYREWIRRSEPFSNVWCDCMNALQLELYHKGVLDEAVEKRNETINRI